MQPFLAIDTSTSLGGVAVGRGDRLLAEVVVGVTARHSESLLPAIDFALRAAGLAPADLAAVVVAGGPGSFTGVRVAGATAKGLVRALGVPLYAYPGLLALAASGAADEPACALFDARRGEVYAACYRFGDDGAIETLVEPCAAPVESVVEAVRARVCTGARAHEREAPDAGGEVRSVPRPVRYIGDGALRYRAAIEAAGGRVAPAHQAAPRAASLLWLADTAPERGRVADASSWEPEYLRPSGAERGIRG